MPPNPDEAVDAGFRLRDEPGHLLRLCQQRAVDLFVQEVGEEGPTPRQFAVLVSVMAKPGLSQTDLVRATGIDRSTLTEIIRRLVRRGLVSRRRTAADQRANALQLTDAGAAAVAKATPAVLRAQARIMAPVPPARRADAMALLALLAGPDDAADQPAGKTMP
ncbi:MAG: MarR family winged helix-turn-helix transcriptional regulator [Rhodospirillales bacterium]